MFNVGDVVVATETSGANNIVVGEEYKVLEIRYICGDPAILINNGHSWGVYSDRFKLKEVPMFNVGGEVQHIEEKGHVEPYRGRTYGANGWWYGRLAALELVEEEYKTPEGVMVKVGDKGVWYGYEYTLVDGPNPRGEGGVHWSAGKYSWNPLTVRGYTLKQENVNKEKEKKLTETTTVTETKIKEVLDGQLSNGAFISTKLWPKGEIELVVGARYSDAYGSFFNKESLTELIEELTAVRDLL